MPRTDMIRHNDIDKTELKKLLGDCSIQYAGHRGLKIYGSLACKSGKRMKRENRVFFESEEEALKNGYRPCGHCLKEAYKKWISLNK